MFRSPALLAALLVSACTDVNVTQQSNALGGGGPALAANVAAHPTASAFAPQGVGPAGSNRVGVGSQLVRASDASLGGAVPEMNRTYSGSVVMLGRTIPLPAGAWTVVARGISAATVDPPSLDIAFIRSSGDALTGLLAIYGTPLGRPASAGFKVNATCAPAEVITADIAAENPGGDQDCLTVRFFRPVTYRDIRANPLVHAIIAQLDARNISAPPVMVGAEVFEADRAHELRMSGYFNPDAAGIAPDLSVQRAQSAWAPYNLPKDPQKVAYVERIKAWGESWRLGLRQLLEERSVPPSADMERTP